MPDPNQLWKSMVSRLLVLSDRCDSASQRWAFLTHRFEFFQEEPAFHARLAEMHVPGGEFWREESVGWLGEDVGSARLRAQRFGETIALGVFDTGSVHVEEETVTQAIQHYASLSSQIHEILTRLASLPCANSGREIEGLLFGTANLPAHPWTLTLYDLAGRYFTPDYAAEIELDGTCDPAPSVRYHVETEPSDFTPTSDATTTVDEGSIAPPDVKSLLESLPGKGGSKVKFTISRAESTMPELGSLAEILARNTADRTTRKDWVRRISLSTDVFSATLNAIHSFRSWLEGEASPMSRLEALQLAETAGKEPISTSFPPIERADQTGRDEENVFQRSGSDWMITYNGQINLYPKLDGLFYLHLLVANQGWPFPPSILVADKISAERGRPTVGDNFAKADDLSLLATDAGPVIDSEALEEYKEAYWELCAEIEKAQGYEKEELVADKEAVEQQLCEALGVGRATLEDEGRARGMTRIKALSPVAKNNRDKVMKAINTALKRIKEKNPAAAVHFDNSLRRETLLCYRPESHIEWLT